MVKQVFVTDISILILVSDRFRGVLFRSVLPPLELSMCALLAWLDLSMCALGWDGFGKVGIVSYNSPRT